MSEVSIQCDGGIPVEDAPVTHFGSGFQLAIIKPLGRKFHDFLVHAVLYFQQRDGGRFVGLPLSHQCSFQTSTGSFVTFYGRRKLAMVPCQYYTVCFADSYPAGGFQGLGGFINKKCAETASVQQTVIAAYKCGGYDMGTVKKLGIDLYFQCGGTVTQASSYGCVSLRVRRNCRGGIYCPVALSSLRILHNSG